MKIDLQSIYNRKAAAIYAISLKYSALAWNYFMSLQPARPGEKGAYWDNQTAQAAARVFADAFIDKESIGFFLSHAVDYGIYLELANNRKHESLRPIIQRYAGRFLNEVKALYAD